jgi:hypothetical protein
MDFFGLPQLPNFSGTGAGVKGVSQPAPALGCRPHQGVPLPAGELSGEAMAEGHPDAGPRPAGLPSKPKEFITGPVPQGTGPSFGWGFRPAALGYRLGDGPEDHAGEPAGQACRVDSISASFILATLRQAGEPR